MKIFLATENKGKVREIRKILAEVGVELITSGSEGVPSLDYPPEDGAGFTENALIKARYAFSVTGITSLADDSGIEVDFLGGAPGIYSARYAGLKATDDDNNDKLIRELSGVPADKRTARFRCVLALVGDGISETFDGVFEGVIAEAPAGGGGFGYDPLFYLPDKGMTSAEIQAEEKNRISHRAKALALLKEWLLECS